MTNAQETSELIKDLIAHRARPDVGAASPEGRRVSLLIEQLANGIPSAQTIAEIAQIQRDGGRYIHANHGAGR